jgi:hypothetical protein
MLRICRAAGCTTLTLGPFCLHHEPPSEPRHYPRGRPYRLKDREVVVPALLLDPAKKEQEPSVVLWEGAG